MVVVVVELLLLNEKGTLAARVKSEGVDSDSDSDSGSGSGSDSVSYVYSIRLTRVSNRRIPCSTVMID